MASVAAFAPPQSALRAPRAVLRAEAAAASEASAAEAPKTYKVIDIPSDKCEAV
jgi:hypothetical protein